MIGSLMPCNSIDPDKLNSIIWKDIKHRQNQILVFEYFFSHELKKKKKKKKKEEKIAICVNS